MRRTVAVMDEVRHDATRNRDVPVRIYVPENHSQPSPVIIFSHGLGGSREGYLLTCNGDHMVFSGRNRLLPTGPRADRFRE